MDGATFQRMIYSNVSKKLHPVGPSNVVSMEMLGRGGYSKTRSDWRGLPDSVSDVGFHGLSKAELKLCKDCILRGYPLIGEVDMATIQHFCSLVIQGHPNIMMKPPRMKYVAKPKVLNRIRIGILRSDAPTPTGALQPERLKGSVVFLLVEADSFPSWKLVDSKNRRMARTYVVLHKDTYQAMYELMTHHDKRMSEWWAEEELKKNVDVARWRIVAHWKTEAQFV